MTYRFSKNRPVERALREIALEQIDGALALASNPGEIDSAVHELRKSCKELRGLVRLVRPAFDAYATENAAFRDAARGLSYLRDGTVLIETYDNLAGIYDGQIERPALASIRRRLTLRHKEAMARHDISARLDDFAARMQAARGRARHWKLDEDGFDAVAGGLARTCKRMRKAMAAAHDERTSEAFHDWRKRTKYHWYHARLLRRIWRDPMKTHARVADQLGDLLGEHHDLAVFRQTLAAQPDAFGGQNEVDVMSGLARRRQATLESKALDHGARIAAEHEDALVRRWRGYWDIWRGGREHAKAALAA